MEYKVDLTASSLHFFPSRIFEYIIIPFSTTTVECKKGKNLFEFFMDDNFNQKTFFTRFSHLYLLIYLTA